MKSYITGIGGVFFRSQNPEKCKAWYMENMGLKSESWGKMFAWRDYDNPEKPGSTSWGPFKNETDYFGNSGQEFMINYRVTNLEELLEHLKTKGIAVVKETESYEYGKFAWIDDADGRRIELWEPADEAFGI